jgi:hypothetical protein
MNKYIASIALLCAGYLPASAQVSSSIGAEFKQLAGLRGGRLSGFEGVQTYKSDNVKGSQFFNEGWKTGSVVTINRKDSISNGYLFLFDKVRQELFIKPKDSVVVLQAEKDQIRSFTINTDRPHLFVQAGSYDPSHKGKFIEVLYNVSNGVSLLKFVQTTFIKADMKDMQKVKDGDLYDEFADNVSYYFYYNNTLSPKLSLTQNNIIKRLEPYKNKAISFFKSYSENDIDESLLIRLTEFINH